MELPGCLPQTWMLVFTTLSASDLRRHPKKNIYSSFRDFAPSWWRIANLLVGLQQKDFCCSWRLDDWIWNTIKTVCLRCVHHIWSKSLFRLLSQQTWAQYRRCKNVNGQHQLDDSLRLDFTFLIFQYVCLKYTNASSLSQTLPERYSMHRNFKQ